jgi:hypothetical protein
MIVHQAGLFPLSSSPALPCGSRYCAEAITTEDECSLIDQIAALPFKEFQFHGFEGKCRSAGVTISANTKLCQPILSLRFCSTSIARFRPLRVSPCRVCSKFWLPNTVLAHRADSLRDSVRKVSKEGFIRGHFPCPEL